MHFYLEGQLKGRNVFGHGLLWKIIVVRGKFRAPLLMRLLFGFPDEKLFMGAYLKSRRDERPQTGAQAPGCSATTKEAPRGRQKQMQVEIKQVGYSAAPSELLFC